MAKPYFVIVLASMLALLVSTPAPAKEDPVSLAQRELAAENRGDVAGALALYSDDAIVQYGGLCWTPCVGKAAIQKELERRVAANLTESQNSTLCIYVVGDRKMWYLGRSFSGSGDRNGRRIE